MRDTAACIYHDLTPRTSIRSPAPGAASASTPRRTFKQAPAGACFLPGTLFQQSCNAEIWRRTSVEDGKAKKKIRVLFLYRRCPAQWVGPRAEELENIASVPLLEFTVQHCKLKPEMSRTAVQKRTADPAAAVSGGSKSSIVVRGHGAHPLVCLHGAATDACSTDGRLTS